MKIFKVEQACNVQQNINFQNFFPRCFFEKNANVAFSDLGLWRKSKRQRQEEDFQSAILSLLEI
jgi:hypothetical protein